MSDECLVNANDPGRMMMMSLEAGQHDVSSYADVLTVFGKTRTQFAYFHIILHSFKDDGKSGCKWKWSKEIAGTESRSSLAVL